MEIGVLPSPRHFLRINTIKNCVIASTTVLEDFVNPARPFWRLVIDNPVGGGVSTVECNHFNRQHEHGPEEDFRWIVDMESEQLYGTLGNRINTDTLMPIMVIPSGVFYTRLRSPELSMLRDGAAEPFGCMASVTGCDIPIFAGRVRLVEQGTGHLIFDFTTDQNTIYEVVNTPPDIEGHEPDEDPCHDQSGELKRRGEGDRPNTASPDPCEHDHFTNYHRLFRNPNEPKICFTKVDAHPAPDPFLCGMVMLGQRKEPFRE